MKARKKYFGKVVALLLIAALCLGCAGITGSYSAYAADDADATVEQVTDESVDQTDESVQAETAAEADAVVAADVSAEDTAVAEDSQNNTDDTKSADSVTEENANDVPSVSVVKKESNTGDSVKATEKEKTDIDSADSSAEEETDTMPAQEFDRKALDGKLTISVKAAEGAFPEGTEMQVKAVNDKNTLDKIEKAAVKKAGSDAEVSEIQAVDISFWNDGEEIEPEDSICVTVGSDLIKDTDEPMVVNVDNGKAKVVKPMSERQLNKNDITPADDEIAFETEQNAVYAVVGMESISTKYLTADGEAYNITITYGPEAEIPAGAELQVKEIPAGTDAFDTYKEQAQDLVAEDVVSEETIEAGGSEENATYELEIVDAPETVEGADFARFFDIEIVSKGKKIEPSAPVEVKIEYADDVELAEGEILQVVHFADEGAEVITPDVSGNEITFMQDSFSVTGTITTNTGGGYQYALLVQYDGKYYEVMYDGTLQEVTESSAGVYTIDMAESWSIGNTISVQTYAGRAYLDPSVAAGHGTTQRQVTRTASGNGVLIHTGANYLGVTTDSTTGKLLISGQNSSSNAATFYYARLESTDNGNSVDHIDVGVAATARVTVPLAYGIYYYSDGSEAMTVDVGEHKNATGVNNNIPISEADLMSAVVSSYKESGGSRTPDNSFIIDEYTRSTGSGQAMDQVRLGGDFPVGSVTLSRTAYRGNVEQYITANNQIYYEVAVTKSVPLTIQDSDGNVLYQEDSSGALVPLQVDVMVTLTADFSYWDDDNTCPGISSYGRTGSGSGTIAPTSGIDLTLGTTDETNATLGAIEIIKYVVGEDKKTIELKSNTDFQFGIYNDADGDPTGPADWKGEYEGTVDRSGYTKITDRTVTVGTSGMGVSYDYSVDQGLVYVTEAAPPDTITDADGNILHYKETYIETEYVWRDNNESSHSNVNQEDVLTAIPDVVGDYYYIDADGNRVTTSYNSETGKDEQLHNTFLEFNVYNVYVQDETEVTVEKIWDDADDQDGVRPDSVEIVLTGSDGNSYKATLDGEKDTAPTGSDAAGYESDAWEATFINLPSKDSGGEVITYEASETKTGVITGTDGPGTYAFEVEGSQEDGFTVTNTHTPEQVEKTITKVWDDEDDKDGIRPDSVEVVLTGSDDNSYKVTLDGTAEGKPSGTEATGYESEAWKATFIYLPKYADGEEIEYTYSETETDVINGTDGPGTYAYSWNDSTVTNKHTPEVPELTEATVKKVWNDNDDQDGNRPESLDVTLSEGTVVTLDESNDWTATVKDLPKYEDDVEIEYTWTEDEDGLPEGYTLTDTSVDGTVTTLTNSYQSDPVKEVYKGSETTNIDGQEVQPGDELTYSITYVNTTGETAETVTITDTIPEYTTYVDGSADNDGEYADGAITWTFEDVADGASITVTFKVTVDEGADGAELTNEAVVNDGTNEYTSNEVTNTIVTPPPTDPVKEVFNAKDETTNIDGKTVKAEDELIYKITYENTTNEEATVEITDTIPKNTTYVSGSADNNGVEKDGTITWSDVKVAAGESVTVSFKVKVTADDGTSVDNVAKVKSGDNEFTSNKTVNPTDKIVKKTVKKIIKKIKKVQTGDDANAMLLSLAAIIAAIAVLAILRRRNKDVTGR